MPDRADSMTHEAERWIEIPSWDRFQHYHDRNAPWIKNYTALLHHDGYLNLSGHRRSILHGLWLEYASSDRRIPVDTASLSRRLALRVTTSDLESLNHAGFIAFRASTPLALRATRARAGGEGEGEEEPPTPSQSEGAKTSLRDNGLNPRALGTNPRAKAKTARRHENIDRVIRQAFAQDWSERSLLDELMQTFQLPEQEAAVLISEHRPPADEDEDW